MIVLLFPTVYRYLYTVLFPIFKHLAFFASILFVLRSVFELQYKFCKTCREKAGNVHFSGIRNNKTYGNVTVKFSDIVYMCCRILLTG
jgi:hypothetical protein